MWYETQQSELIPKNIPQQALRGCIIQTSEELGGLESGLYSEAPQRLQRKWLLHHSDNSLNSKPRWIFTVCGEAEAFRVEQASWLSGTCWGFRFHRMLVLKLDIVYVVTGDQRVCSVSGWRWDPKMLREVHHPHLPGASDLSIRNKVPKI